MKTIGRNDPCPCGSGKKYKKCCEEKDQHTATNTSAPALIKNAPAPKQFLDKSNIEISKHYELEHLASHPPHDRYVINTWWYLYDQMKSPDEIRLHLETFFKRHSPLVEHLGLDRHVVFGLASSYLEEHRPNEFISFLTDFRKRFPAAYAPAGSLFDQYIIAWLAAEGEGSEVKHYIDYFFDNPDDIMPALWAFNILVAANMGEQALAITEKGDFPDKVLLTILFHFLPSLKDFTTEGIDDFIAHLQHSTLTVDNFDLSFWRKKLMVMSRPYTPWPDKAPSKKDYPADILFEPVTQFTRYLHDELNLTWLTAQFYADNVGDYLLTYHQERKKRAPRLFHFPSQEVIEKHLENISVDEVGMRDTTKYFTTINALYYFAAYLNKCGNFTEEEMEILQGYCAGIFEETYPREEEFSYDALFFREFPVWGYEEVV